MGKTIIYVRDGDESAQTPHTDNIWEFAVYNEAMSFAKWLDYHYISGSNGDVFVWNYDGGSGYWRNSNFTSIENSNYPS